MAQDKKITLDEIAQGIGQGLNTADEHRAASFEQLQSVRRAKATSLQREQARLNLKYGSDHPRVQAIANKVVINDGLRNNVATEVVRARTEIPVVDEHTWVLHGYVRHTDGSGIQNLTVALYDGDSQWVQALGHACTAANGYFRLENTSEFLRNSFPVYVHVLTSQVQHLYADKSALRPTPGRVDYKEIIITGDVQVCVPPDLSRNEPMPSSDAWIVQGRVTDAQGRGVGGLIVSLYDKDLFFDDRLGETETDAQGNYSLVYYTKDFRDLIERKPDIYLKVLNQKGETLYSSKREIRYESGRVEIINIELKQ
ncbi:MAG TPA: hypothetical protein VKB86_12695 [Pyrinomonadaceae bacterium]|nr:hypothetical protein [Pyrinomonadaceae bacterium]